MAQRTLKTTKRQNETMYIVRRPSLSLNEDHHSGNMDMLSMYKEMDKLVMVVVVCISFVTRAKEGKNMELPMGAVAPATATMNVMNHLVFRGYSLGFSTSASRVNCPKSPRRFNLGTTVGPGPIDWSSCSLPSTAGKP